MQRFVHGLTRAEVEEIDRRPDGIRRCLDAIGNLLKTLFAPAQGLLRLAAARGVTEDKQVATGHAIGGIGVIDENRPTIGSDEVGPTAEPPSEARDEATEVDGQSSPSDRGRTTLPWRTHATSASDRPTVDPLEAATGTTVCEALGCDRPLTASQLARGAKACSPACRARAHREARQRRRLRGIDDATRLLAELRSEIANDRRG